MLSWTRMLRWTRDNLMGLFILFLQMIWNIHICNVLEMIIYKYGEGFYLYMFKFWNYIWWISSIYIYETVVRPLYRIKGVQTKIQLHYYFKKNYETCLTVVKCHKQSISWRLLNVMNIHILDGFETVMNTHTLDSF